MDELLHKITNDQNIILILDSFYDGIYIVNTKREILFWNKGAERITGFNQAEVVHHRCADNILNHIDKEGNPLCLLMCPLKHAMIEDRTIEETIYPLRKDKTRFPVLTRISPIKDKNGAIVGAIEIFRDVSKEEQLRVLQEKFNELIRKYVSATTYETVIKQARTGKIVPAQMIDMTILYVDVVGFSLFANRNTLPDIAYMLNEVFGLCEMITKKFHGDIDKFIGDAIMATFHDANDAVTAAGSILEELKLFNKNRETQGKEAIHLHIGINSGSVIRAEIGTSERKDLTVLGNAVNIAHQVQEISLPDEIFISEATFSRIEKADCFIFYDKINVKDRIEPVTVFRSLCVKDQTQT